MTGPAIEALGLQRTYISTRGFLRRERVEQQALRSVDLSVERGQLFGLLGPNGAGKTTMVKIFTTLLLPTAGSAKILGFDVNRQTDAIRRRIGFVFGGERGLYWRLSGVDNLRYFADLYEIPPDIARRRIAELLERLGLKGREKDKVEGYSRGMKQRLHLARGLLNDPEVLFLDEPTIGLDPVGARELRAIARGLADQGKTVFLTTHYIFEAEEICDRVAVLKTGQIVAQGSPVDIKRAVEDRGIVEFETEGLPHDRIEHLRGLPGVATVITEPRELSQVVTIHCSHPADLSAGLANELQGFPFRRLVVREPTLEDAYVLLVST